MSDSMKTITERMTFDQVQKLVDEKYTAGAMVKRMVTWEIEDPMPWDTEWEWEINTVHRCEYLVQSHKKITELIQDMICDYMDCDHEGDVWWTILVIFSDRTSIHAPVYAKWRYGDMSIGEPFTVKVNDDE